MIRVLLMDDEELGLNLLNRVLDSFQDIEVIGAYTDSVIGLQEIKRLKPDVCFLDVEMPGLSGLQVANALIDDKIIVIFVTAYQQYAIEAFRVNAVDYILKPVTKDEISRVLTKIHRSLHKQLEAKVTPLTVYFFGDLHVYHKGSELDWPTEKTAELFAYLIFHQKTKISKWQLCDILWPDVDPKKAMHNVYNSIYRLKQLFKKTDIPFKIISKKGYYELNLYNAHSDFQKMDLFINDLSPINDQSITEYERIETLYTGEFLSTKGYSWSIHIQEHYHQWYMHIVKELLAYYIRNHDARKALILGRKVLAHTPEVEEIARMLVPLYLQKGSRELLQYYKDYMTHFEQEINTVLSATTIHCFEEALRNSKPPS